MFWLIAAILFMSHICSYHADFDPWLKGWTWMRWKDVLLSVLLLSVSLSDSLSLRIWWLACVSQRRCAEPQTPRCRYNGQTHIHTHTHTHTHTHLKVCFTFTRLHNCRNTAWSMIHQVQKPPVRFWCSLSQTFNSICLFFQLCIIKKMIFYYLY